MPGGLALIMVAGVLGGAWHRRKRPVLAWFGGKWKGRCFGAAGPVAQRRRLAPAVSKRPIAFHSSAESPNAMKTRQN